VWLGEWRKELGSKSWEMDFTFVRLRTRAGVKADMEKLTPPASPALPASASAEREVKAKEPPRISWSTPHQG